MTKYLTHILTGIKEFHMNLFNSGRLPAGDDDDIKIKRVYEILNLRYFCLLRYVLEIGHTLNMQQFNSNYSVYVIVDNYLPA